MDKKHGNDAENLYRHDCVIMVAGCPCSVSGNWICVTIPPRVAVIGDLHGCYESIIAAFRLAVQDANGHASTIKY